jgi:hypothetical protein
VVTSCSSLDPPATSYSSPDPPATGYYYGYATAQQEQPYTTITSGTIVYVVMPSTGAVAGQVTNGVVQIASVPKWFSGHDGSLMTNSFALVVIMLALTLM